MLANSLLPIANGPPMLMESGVPSTESSRDGTSFTEILDRQIESSYEPEEKQSAADVDEEMAACAAAEPQKPAAREPVQAREASSKQAEEQAAKKVAAEEAGQNQTVQAEQAQSEAAAAALKMQVDLEAPVEVRANAQTQDADVSHTATQMTLNQAEFEAALKKAAQSGATAEATEAVNAEASPDQAAVNAKAEQAPIEMKSLQEALAAEPIEGSTEANPASDPAKGQQQGIENTNKMETMQMEARVKTAQTAAQSVEESTPAIEGVEADPIELNPIQVTMQQKITEPARMAEARGKAMVPQISSGIEDMVRSGKSSMRLQLHPENLGRITLKLVQDSGGMQIVIHADSADTNSLLERNLDDLYRSLSQAGLDVAGFNIGGQNNNQANSRDSFQEATSRMFNAGSGSDEQDESSQSARPAPRPTLSAVDYLI